LRKGGDYLEQEVIQDTAAPASGAQGRPGMTRTDKKNFRTYLSFHQLLRETRNRRRWNEIVLGAAKPRIEDGL